MLRQFFSFLWVSEIITGFNRLPIDKVFRCQKNLISFTENNLAAKDSFNNFQNVASTHPL